jgi:hypothetical protein
MEALYGILHYTQQRRLLRGAFLFLLLVHEVVYCDFSFQLKPFDTLQR